MTYNNYKITTVKWNINRAYINLSSFSTFNISSVNIFSHENNLYDEITLRVQISECNRTLYRKAMERANFY